MILQSLCGYYDILAEANVGIPIQGTSMAKISFGLVLAPNGEISQIVDLRVQAAKGKKLVPILMPVPEQPGRTSGIKAYFLSDKSDYILGLKDDKPTPQHFEAFKAYQLEILDDLDDPDAQAVINFVQNWQPEQALERLGQNPDFAEEMLASANFVFMNEAHDYIHTNAAIQARWQQVNAANLNDAVTGYCLIDGEEGAVALLHPQIKGVRDAQATGASLVSYNAGAFRSYGKEDGRNSPVSEKNAFKYTTVLNWLLRGESTQRIVIGDATVVFWAENASGEYPETLIALANYDAKAEKDKTPEEKTRDSRFEKKIKSILEAHKTGIKPPGYESDLDPETQFYILGLAPNNARISVRFFLRDTFGGFVEHINRHYEDLELTGNRWRFLPLWLLLNQTVNQNARDKAPSPVLAGNVATAVFTGQRYPDGLLTAVLQRIRADHNVNDIRASIIKAYLKRNIKKYKEVLTVSLNTETTSPAYLLGRLFAVLERLQENAQGDINKTIKDSYFSTASAAPRVVFPRLIKLAQHHLAKLGEKGRWLDILMGRILSEITAFPAGLSYDEQGLFILGYYQQRQDFFTKKEDKDLAATDDNE